jgi:hypothetical protein
VDANDPKYLGNEINRLLLASADPAGDLSTMLRLGLRCL